SLHTGSCNFLGTDGWHAGEVVENGQVKISMKDVQEVLQIDDRTSFAETGSPHLVRFVEELDNLDVDSVGRKLRNDPRFAPDGLNVNFVRMIEPGVLEVRTYERGVENETL